VAVLGGVLGGAIVSQTLTLAPPIDPPKTKMLHTQKAKIEILGFLAS